MNEKGETIGKNVYEQTIYCFEKIKKVLGYGGFSKKDVVLIKAYLVNMKDIGRFDKVFINRFFDIKPGCTLVGIKELVKPNLLVEVECIAEKNL